MATTDSVIRPAQLDDVDAIAALLPELAAFDTPAARDPKELWEGDLQTLHRWRDGMAPNVMVHVADNGQGTVVGFTIVSLREEAMNHSPSSHLEAIVVAAAARGTGLGKRLLANAEQRAASAGAQSMTLHVFSNNRGARAVYQKSGYDEELIRAFKILPGPKAKRRTKRRTKPKK